MIQNVSKCLVLHYDSYYNTEPFFLNIQTLSVITILRLLQGTCNFVVLKTVQLFFGKKYAWVGNYDITEITELQALVICNLTGLKINNWFKMLQSVWYYIMTVITVLNFIFFCWKHSNGVRYYDITLITGHM